MGLAIFSLREFVVEMQRTYGSDILMPIDDCAPYPASRQRLEDALQRTHRWLDRSKQHWLKLEMQDNQSLFSIVQGGVDLELRKESAMRAADLELPGNAIGGLSVGEKGAEFRESLQVACENLPPGSASIPDGSWFCA